MTCKYYKFENPETPLTIELLYQNFLGLYESREIKYEPLVFSKENLLIARQERLEELKNDNKGITLVTGTTMDESPASDVGIAIATYLTSGMAALNGEPICEAYNEEDFKRVRMNKLVESGEAANLTEAEPMVDREIIRIKIMRELSVNLHKLGISKYIGRGKEKLAENRANFITQGKSIVGADSILNNETLLGTLFDELNNRFYKYVKSFHDSVGEAKATCVRNINLTGTDRDGNKIFAHIDYAFISKDGSIHIYNFKASSKIPSDWSKEKIKTYQAELALLKQILVLNGVANTKDIKVHFVPIIGFYKDDELNTLSVSEHLWDFGSRLDIEEDWNNKAKALIHSGIKIKPPTADEDEIVRNLLNLMFPGLEIYPETIARETDEWIRRAPSSFAEEKPLVIQRLDDNPDYSYVVIIRGKKHYVKEKSLSKESNGEIRRIVFEHIHDLNEDLPESTSNVIDAINHTYAHNLADWDFKRIKHSEKLRVILSKYIAGERDSDGKIIRYKWKLDTSLAHLNILLFINEDTKEVDVVSLTDRNLYLSPKYKYGKNILGQWCYDTEFLLKGNWGHIEMVRALMNLNLLIGSNESLKGIKLGQIKTFSTQGQSRTYNIEHFIKDYLEPMVQKIKSKESQFSYKNNLVEFMDLFESVMVEANNINDDGFKVLAESALSQLEELTKENKKAKLLALLELFLQNDYFRNIADNAIDISKENGNTKRHKLARLYLNLTACYLAYTNLHIAYEDKLSTISKYGYTAPTVPDSNINCVVTNLQITIDNIAEECEKEYTTNLRKFIMEFLEAAGYTSLENMTLGTQNRIFKNLFLTDEKGKLKMMFKNPYTDSTLKDYEKTFLKKALFYFNKYNYGNRKGFTGWNDPEIPKFIESGNENYLWVPLERASKSTQRLDLNLDNKVKRMRNVWEIIMSGNSQNIYDEVVNKMRPDEREYILGGIDDLQMTNPFLRNEDERNEYISKQGVEYFETNIENLLVDCMFKCVQTEKMNRMLIGTKALLTLLEILGEESGYSDPFKEASKYIRDYINVNVFDKTLIESGTNKVLVSALTALRHKVVFINLAFNAIAAVRDTINGLMENFVRTCSHHLTNISKKSLAEAYVYVIKEGSFDARKMTLLNKLCVRYRISNTDTARIAERLKTDRQGLANYDNIAYSTLRAPDFLNRMTLFVARAIEDGVIDPFNEGNTAWSVDENGDLKYNWKKDKRFEIYARGDKTHPKYGELKALYRLYIREWNAEHPNPNKEELLKDTDDLPTPYSNQDINAIKNVSNNIYGSYDKSTKSMFEHIALGFFFGQYTTWMNGIVNNWFLLPGKYSVHRMLTEQEKGENGELVWEKEDGTLTYENTGIPRLKHVPFIALGVIPALNTARKTLMNDGFNASVAYIRSQDHTKHVLLHAALQSGLAALFLMLFKFALDPKYKDLKKHYKLMDKVAVLWSEMSYKAFDAATDSFYGPWNIVKYLGKGTDPPVYNVPLKAIADGWKFVLGDKTFGLFITGTFSAGRLFRELTK